MAQEAHKFIRKAGPLEVLTPLFHDLGIQSNVLVSAEYSRKDHLLTPPRVFRVLEKVIGQHTYLSIIGVTKPSEKKAGNHRLWEVRLPSLRFQDCVEFVDNQINANSVDNIVASTFESINNQWFDAQNKSKPWWKLYVVNGKYAVFAYHHSIGDGLSGYAFHKSFLAALNEDSLTFDDTSDETSNTIPNGIFKIQHPKEPPANPLDQIEDKIFWPYILYGFFFWILIRLFVNPKHFLFSDATFSKNYPTPAKPFPATERTITRLQVIRISNKTMDKCLAACRQNRTSFTALLHTLVQITLAVDIYPNSKIGFSRLAVDLRPFLKTDLRDEFTNTGCAYYRQQLLGKYRAASPQDKGSQDTTHLAINRPVIWKLAAEYKRDLNERVKSRKILQDFIVCRSIGEDDEEIGKFTGMGLYQNNSFLISNLGVFEPKEGMQDGGWSVKDVGFSAGTIRAALGDFGIAFNVASASGGDCVVVATYEEGVLKQEMVKAVLGAVLRRLELLME